MPALRTLAPALGAPLRPDQAVIRRHTFTVYAEPIPWHRTGSNQRFHAHFKRKEDIQAQFLIKASFLSAHPEATMSVDPIRLEVTCYMPAPKAMSKKRRRDPLAMPIGVPDVDNLAKQVKDALEGVAYRNDSQVVTLLIRKRYALDEAGADTQPRWEIIVDFIVPDSEPVPRLALLREWSEQDGEGEQEQADRHQGLG